MRRDERRSRDIGSRRSRGLGLIQGGDDGIARIRAAVAVLEPSATGA
jgi:hypothetical protein